MSIKYFIYELKHGLLLRPTGFEYDARLDDGFESQELAIDFLKENNSAKGEYVILLVVVNYA